MYTAEKDVDIIRNQVYWNGAVRIRTCWRWTSWSRNVQWEWEHAEDRTHEDDDLETKKLKRRNMWQRIKKFLVLSCTLCLFRSWSSLCNSMVVVENERWLYNHGGKQKMTHDNQHQISFCPGTRGNINNIASCMMNEGGLRCVCELVQAWLMAGRSYHAISTSSFRLICLCQLYGAFFCDKSASIDPPFYLHGINWRGLFKDRVTILSLCGKLAANLVKVRFGEVSLLSESYFQSGQSWRYLNNMHHTDVHA